MGVLDAPANRIALTLLQKFGQTVTLREVVTGTFQPATDTVGNTTIEHPVKAIVPQKVSREARGLMKEGDQVHLIAATSLPSGKVPTTDWEIRPPNSEALREIVGVTAIVAGDTAALYEIVSRGT